MLRSLTASGLFAPGGFLTTTLHSGQQWDFPNAWSPLQDMLIVGLRDTGHPPAAALARVAARRWLNNSLTSDIATGSMHEKLRGDVVGALAWMPTQPSTKLKSIDANGSCNPL